MPDELERLLDERGRLVSAVQRENNAIRARLREAERLLRLAEDHIPSDWVYWRDDYHKFVDERPADTASEPRGE